LDESVSLKERFAVRDEMENIHFMDKWYVASTVERNSRLCSIKVFPYHFAWWVGTLLLLPADETDTPSERV
jgi:hypothetical protein